MPRPLPPTHSTTMKRILILHAALSVALASASAQTTPPWHFEVSGGNPVKLVWETEAGTDYHLYHSYDLKLWNPAAGFPKTGTGGFMEYPFGAGAHGFFLVNPTTVPEMEFALIPAGSFEMGDQSDPKVGWDEELPVHTVYVSAFYMAKYETTKELWDEVRGWGLANGYTDLPAGNGSFASKRANHPVHSINWYAMVEWCNARSQMEGLTPCYTVSGAVYTTGSSDAVSCNWAASGYRLPTEAEWEKAARGGVVGKNFPWGDTISHSQANYYSDSYFSYDVSPTRGYHPDYAVGEDPYTSPVGSFAANGYGLYDMAGNVWEWCWDWFDSYASSPGSDPRGPASGSHRVFRGGSWDGLADNCRAAYRCFNNPSDTNCEGGFRLARTATP